MGSAKPKKQRWYLGGFAGAGAVLFTHSLDLLKVCEAKFQYVFLLIAKYLHKINNQRHQKDTRAKSLDIVSLSLLLI